MRGVYLLVAIICFNSHSLIAAEPPVAYQSDLHGMIGEWSGTLRNWASASDTSRDVVPATLSADTVGGVVVTRFVYDHTDGEQVVQWGEWTVSPDGKKLQMDVDKSWLVTGKTLTDNGTTLVYQAAESDNKKPAQVTYVLWIGHQDSLVLTKKLLYFGGGREFVRNEFRLGKVKE